MNRMANEPEPCASGTHAPWPLASAPCLMIHAITGFANKSLRGRRRATRASYGTSQMTGDLRRLRLHGLIQHLPHSNSSTIYPRAAVFSTNLHGPLFAPLLAADRQPASAEKVRRAPATVDETIADDVTNVSHSKDPRSAVTTGMGTLDPSGGAPGQSGDALPGTSRLVALSRSSRISGTEAAS
jgi:hypothetical protein